MASIDDIGHVHQTGDRPSPRTCLLPHLAPRAAFFGFNNLAIPGTAAGCQELAAIVPMTTAAAARARVAIFAPDPQGDPSFTHQTWHGHFTSFGRQREDLAPVLEVRGRFACVRLEPEGRTLRSTYACGWTAMVAPRRDTHALVVAEPVG